MRILASAALLLAMACEPAWIASSCTAPSSSASASSPLSSALGWLYFGIICVVALAAPVLLVATGLGSY